MKPRKPQLDPAAEVIRRLGGFTKVARVVGRHVTQVYRWTQPAPKGTGGTIPQKHHVALLDHARSIDVPLTAAEFLPRQFQEAAE